ncbi:MAG: 3'-5' exonuclease [Puniceicoccales bacterium]|nr:3'-5' exonuclease [Puniceicoccales bacterium]
MVLAGQWKVYAIDFEGNGRDGVLEFGAICLTGGKLQNPLESFCRCRRGAGIFICRRKIPDVSTANAAPIGDFFERFRSMRGNGILAAHHASTEDALLRSMWPSPGLVPDWHGLGASAAATWGPWIDSHRLAQKFWPGLDSYALGDTLAALGLGGKWRELGRLLCSPERKKMHCALYDAIGCALLVDKCLAESGASPIDLLRAAHGTPQLRLSEMP